MAAQPEESAKASTGGPSDGPGQAPVAPPAPDSGRELDLDVDLEDVVLGGPAPPPGGDLLDPDADAPAAGAPAADLSRRDADFDRARVKLAGADERRVTIENVRRPIDFSGYEFGAYTVLSEIARGGMGVLFRARQRTALAADPKLRLPEEVALKVIMTRASASAQAADVERFIREIRVLITLSHPNIVRIWDAGKESGLHFYTMELIRGAALKELVRDRPMPLVLSLSVVREIASALGALHQAGMLHRDVKPANILMDRDQAPFRPVLIDFGLIRGKFAGKLTGGQGEVAGTPAYMAPEATDAATAHEAGPPSDLYSLGAVLYYLVTRRSPFLGSRADDVIKQVREDPVKPPRALVPELPTSVEAIILRCLEKRPEKRYASMRELMAALDGEIQGRRRAIRMEAAWERVRRKLFGASPPKKARR